jgi:hypothetical protein
MNVANIVIESLPDGIEKPEDLGCLQPDTDIVIFSGEVTIAIDQKIIETIFQERRKNNEKICLILCTPGGDIDSAYLTSRKLNRLYDNFVIIVNGYCKSAGTLLALGANELVVTHDSEFGPLDVQVFSPDEFMRRSSGLTITQAADWINNQVFEAFEHFFLRLRRRSGGNITTKTASEVASVIASELYSKIMDKLDPVSIGDLQRAIDIAVKYGARLDVPEEIIDHLVKGYPSHSFVIDFEEALELFPRSRLIKQSECFMLIEIQRILANEYGLDLTQIPDDSGFIGLVHIDIQNVNKNVDKKEGVGDENKESKDTNGSENNNKGSIAVKAKRRLQN